MLASTASPSSVAHEALHAQEDDTFSEVLPRQDVDFSSDRPLSLSSTVSTSALSLISPSNEINATGPCANVSLNLCEKEYNGLVAANTFLRSISLGADTIVCQEPDPQPDNPTFDLQLQSRRQYSKKTLKSQPQHKEEQFVHSSTSKTSKRPLYANCPTSRTRVQWQRSLGSHLVSSRVYICKYGGAPAVVTSILCNLQQRRSGSNAHEHPIHPDIAVLAKPLDAAGVSYAALLDESANKMSFYEPGYLDDPNFKSGKHRTVVSLPCYMSSVISFSRAKDLRDELNHKFRMKHQWLNPEITLSKIRKMKYLILKIVLDLDMEVATAALACAYFEQLVLCNRVEKSNRREIAAASLFLASKFNTSNGLKEEHLGLSKLIEMMAEVFNIRKNDILSTEPFVFLQIEFNLHLQVKQFLPHFTLMLKRMDTDAHEYLGAAMFAEFCDSVGLSDTDL